MVEMVILRSRHQVFQQQVPYPSPRVDLQEGSQGDCKDVLEDAHEKNLGLAAPLRGREGRRFQWAEACLYRRSCTAAAEGAKAHTQVVAVAARSQEVLGQVESQVEEDRDNHIAEIDLDEDMVIGKLANYIIFDLDYYSQGWWLTTKSI